MRTKPNDWGDPKTGAMLYGIDVLHGGDWCHAAENGKPLLFTTTAERDAKRAELRKLRRWDLFIDGHPTGFFLWGKDAVGAWCRRGIALFGLDWRVGFHIRFRMPTGHFGACNFEWKPQPREGVSR